MTMRDMVVDDLVMTDDYATEKLRLELQSPTAVPPRIGGDITDDDSGITRLRPPPPPIASASLVTADQYHAVCLCIGDWGGGMSASCTADQYHALSPGGHHVCAFTGVSRSPADTVCVHGVS